MNRDWTVGLPICTAGYGVGRIILNQIYEMDFKGFSYGIRPGRDPHQALDALSVGIHSKLVNWVLDADICRFFGNVSHESGIEVRRASQLGSVTSAIYRYNAVPRNIN